MSSTLTGSKYHSIPDHDVVRIGTTRDSDGGVGGEPFEVSDKTTFGGGRLHRALPSAQIGR